MKDKPFVLILCGGKSLRLWPLSKYKSKNFLDIFGFSPLELTIKRFLKITPANNIFLIASESERDSLKKIKQIKKTNILFEPQSKNTAAAVLLGLSHIRKYLNNNVIISPVDALIQKEKEFYKALNKALKEAKGGGICTLGIKPDTPTSNFGYIQTKGASKGGLYSVKRFIEKPSTQKAKKLIAAGNVFYNSGIFIASLVTLMKEYQKHYDFYEKFIVRANGKKLKSLYRKISNIAFDKAIMEKTKNIKLIKGNFYWKDFGSWSTIYDILNKDKDKNVGGNNVFTENSSNNLFYLDNKKKKVLGIGLKNIFFIDTKDYALLVERTHLNKLKQALQKFQKLR